jgi:hypothetical protein
MTIAELIEALGAFDSSLLVYIAGCDCIADADNVTENPHDSGAVLITRGDEVFPL